MGVPITAFAGTIGIVSPYGAGLVGRFGARGVLILGCIPAAIGYLLAAQAETIEAFTLWRALTGCGVRVHHHRLPELPGLLRGAAQPDGGRVRVCRDDGGAVRDGDWRRAGRPAGLSGHLRHLRPAHRLIAAGADLVGDGPADTGKRPVAAEIRCRRAAHARPVFLHNPRFMALVFFAAVPAKLVLTGFVFYISPLALQALDNTQPEIGRQVMLYSATMLLTIRAGAWLSDRLRRGLGADHRGGDRLQRRVAAVAGAAAVGSAAAGHRGCRDCRRVLASAPMLVVVPELCSEAAIQRWGIATLFGYMRFGERIGSIIGPILTTMLVAACSASPMLPPCWARSPWPPPSPIGLITRRRNSWCDPVFSTPQACWPPPARSRTPSIARAAPKPRIVMLTLAWVGGGLRRLPRLPRRATGSTPTTSCATPGRPRPPIPGLVADIKTLKPNLVFIWGGSTALSPRSAVMTRRTRAGILTDIPAVLAIVADPLGSGVVDNLDKPGPPGHGHRLCRAGG